MPQRHFIPLYYGRVRIAILAGVRARQDHISLGRRGRPLYLRSAGEALFKGHPCSGNHTIRIVRTTSATTITPPRSSTRIRRSYDRVLSPPRSEIRLTEPANPLA